MPSFFMRAQTTKEIVIKHFNPYNISDDFYSRLRIGRVNTFLNIFNSI